MISLSSGHWTVGTGASDIIDEVTESRKVVTRVVEILRVNKVTTNMIMDDCSKNQSQNLKYLVNEHNATSRQLDVSVHFNSSIRTSKGVGVEVLYMTQKDLANKVSFEIAGASGLINRGAKLRNDLAFLKGTNKPAILIEVCFVSSTVDVAIYKRDFEKICQSIAKCLADFVGKSLDSKEVKAEMVFSSKSLKAETEIILSSKARRTMIVEAAIAAGADEEEWRRKHDNFEMTDADYLALAAKAIISPQLTK